GTTIKCRFSQEVPPTGEELPRRAAEVAAENPVTLRVTAKMFGGGAGEGVSLVDALNEANESHPCACFHKLNTQIGGERAAQFGCVDAPDARQLSGALVRVIVNGGQELPRSGTSAGREGQRPLKEAADGRFVGRGTRDVAEL